MTDKYNMRYTDKILLRCPNCKAEHKRRPTGEYCNMTCYYARLRKDADKIRAISEEVVINSHANEAI